MTQVSPTQRSRAAQRINVGLTTLALVFLTVVTAAAGVSASRPKGALNPRTETLAVLGVTPSSGSASTLGTAPAESHRAVPRSKAAPKPL